MANQKPAAKQLRPEADDEDETNSRTERVSPAEREPRTQRMDAATERTLSTEDRLELFRNRFRQARLPDLPPIPGFHVCWASTTNPSDSIHHRMRLGYELIKAEDIPGYEYVSIKTGDWVGAVGVNEMLAMKLPDELYQLYMQEAHHNEPNRMDEALRANLESLSEGAKRDGGKLIEGDGMRELRERRSPQAPVFAD